MKRQLDNIFTDTSDKGLIAKIYKELIKFNNNNKIQLTHGQRI